MLHKFITKTLYKAALAGFAIISAFAQSQATTGTIEGDVRDQRGGALNDLIEDKVGGIDDGGVWCGAER